MRIVLLALRERGPNLRWLQVDRELDGDGDVTLYVSQSG